MAPGLALAAVLYASAPAAGPRAARTERFLDTGLLAGPVGALAVVGILSNVAFVTFTNAVPLWLVAGGVPGEGALIGWTLAAFSGAAALGGLGGGALSTRVPRRLLGAGSMLLALPALLAVHALAPGTGPFFAAVALAGALLNASTPLLLVTAQDLAPRAVGTASGLFMGLTVGVAGLLYVPIGRLQEAIGLGPAMAVSYLALLPAAALAWRVLGRVGGTVAPARGALAGAASAEARCACGSAGTFAGASDQRARRLLENPR
jgi:FSR family fosmidomycin resistance protein-like MFS transporter